MSCLRSNAIVLGHIATLVAKVEGELIMVLVIIDICTDLSSPPIPYISKFTASTATTVNARRPGLASLRVFQRSSNDRTKIQRGEKCVTGTKEGEGKRKERRGVRRSTETILESQR